jgi:hypothetical protein
MKMKTSVGAIIYVWQKQLEINSQHEDFNMVPVCDYARTIGYSYSHVG